MRWLGGEDGHSDIFELIVLVLFAAGSDIDAWFAGSDSDDDGASSLRLEFWSFSLDIVVTGSSTPKKLAANWSDFSTAAWRRVCFSSSSVGLLWLETSTLG